MLRYFHNISFRSFAKTTGFVSLGSATAYYFHDLHSQPPKNVGYNGLTKTAISDHSETGNLWKMTTTTTQNGVKTPFQVSPSWAS